MTDGKHNDSSYITGGVRRTLLVSDGTIPGTSYGDTIEETAMQARSTEIAAIRPRASSPAYQAWLALHWARIASQPSAFPHVNDRPRRAQSGEQLLEWVAVRTGLTAVQVENYLEAVDAYMESEDRGA